MNSLEIEKINRFLGDKSMSQIVHSIILGSFLKKRDGDVYTKAAQRMAIDFLEDAWKDLENSRHEQKDKKKDIEQVGL